MAEEGKKNKQDAARATNAKLDGNAPILYNSEDNTLLSTVDKSVIFGERDKNEPKPKEKINVRDEHLSI